MPELEWKAPAIADLLAIVDYIADDNPDAALALLAGDDLLQCLFQCLTELQAAVSDHEERADKGDGCEPRPSDLRVLLLCGAPSFEKSHHPSDCLRADPKELCDLRQRTLFFIPHPLHLDPLNR